MSNEPGPTKEMPKDAEILPATTLIIGKTLVLVSWHTFGEDVVIFPSKSWQRFYGRRSMAEKEDGSNGTIVPFVTSNNSRRDNETCWLLEVRSLTNLPDSVILSPKTKGSVIPQKRELVV